MSDISFDFSGRHVLVTGTSRGIGAATARAFLDAGAKVSGVSRSPMDDTQDHDRALWIAADLTENDAAGHVVAAAKARFGPIDIAVHNVGGSIGVRDVLAPSADWHRVMQLNLGIAIDLNNLIVPEMVERGWGRLVHLSSRSGIDMTGAPAYSAAKAALNAYVVSLGRAYADKGVLANGIMPNAVVSPGNNWEKAEQNNPERVRQFLETRQAIQRLAVPQDIIPAVLYLSSSANCFMTGTTILVDGGAR